MTKTTFILTAASLLVAGFAATAQTPPENHWDISKIDVSKLPPASTQTGLTFEKDIQPLFKASCVRCHGEQKPRAGLRLDTLEGTLKGGRDGKMVIPGDGKKSLLVVAAAQIDPGTAMPPKRRARNGQGGPGGPPPAAKPDGAPSASPAGGPGKSGPMAKPLTSEQAGLLRAWVDQGAK